VPATPQAADKAAPAGDRTRQILHDVAVRGRRLVAVGGDESSNLLRPMFLTSDDGGGTWTRRSPDLGSTAGSTRTEIAHHVAAGSRGFLATGESAIGPEVWTSADGELWIRRTANRAVFRPADDIELSAATVDGFVMVGSGRTGLVVWRSRDGITWQRRSAQEAGLRSTGGDVSVTDIVAQGNTVVVSGDLDSTQTNQMLFWYSTDAGVTFRPGVIGGKERPYWPQSGSLTVAEGKFYALARDNWSPGSEDGSWHGVILEGGTTGRSWRVASTPRALDGQNDLWPESMVKAGKDWVVAYDLEETNTDDVFIAAGPGLEQLSDRTHETQSTLGNQYVNGMVTVGRDAVMVGSTDRSGTIEPMIWRYQDGGVSPIRLPAEATDGRPSTTVRQLMQVGSEMVAVGGIGQNPAGWSPAATGWQATVLPGPKLGVEPRLDAASTTPDGRILAVGAATVPTGQRAKLWMRDRRGRWTEASSPQFRHQSKYYSGGPAARAVAAGTGGWVMAGVRADGGGNQDAWVVHSRDGKTWTEARGGRPVTGKDSEYRAHWDVFRAPDGGSAWVDAVMPYGVGFVAVGGVFADGKNSPMAWRSSDGATWQRATRPPVPKGVGSVRVEQLLRVGSILIAAGEIDRADDDVEPGWIAWSSADAGRSWRVSTGPPRRKASVMDLVSVPAGVVALGSAGPSSDTDAAGWFSRDGQTWAPLDLPGDRVKGAGYQGLDTGVVTNGKLLIAAYDVPPGGGGHYVLEVDLPK